MKEFKKDLVYPKNIINNLDLDTPIYKYMPLKYLIALLQSEKLYVGKVLKWEDVYENFWFRLHFVSSNGTSLSAENLIKNNFGQSWTYADETDAMWRIYSQLDFEDLDNVAVRIKTTARKLFDAVFVNQDCMATTYIGSVKYLTLKEMNSWISNMKLNINNLSRYMAESLFIKRTEFLHESEVRIMITLGCNDPKVNDPNLSFSVDPRVFLEEYLIDPRLINTPYADDTKDRLVSCGVDKSKIKVSELYHSQPLSTPIVIENC